MFYYIGLVISFFLFILLVSKKGKSTPDKILAFWLFIIGVHIFLFISRVNVQIIRFPILLGLEFPMPLLHGPLLYVYSLFLTGRYRQGKFAWILHFIAPAISLIAVCPFMFSSIEYKVAVFKNMGKGYEIFMITNLVAIYISALVYTILSLIVLRKHAREIVHQFSYTEKISLNWLRYLVYGLCVIWLVVAYGEDSLIFISLVVFVFLLGFFGIKQNGIFTHTTQFSYSNLPPIESSSLNNQISKEEKYAFEGSVSTDVKPKYAKSGLSAEQSKSIHNDLLGLMKKKRLFIEPTLSLNDLADELQIHPNYLSQSINEQEGKNFYDFINYLRVEEFKRISTLPENKKYTILTLSIDAGFNSKSSFNRYFKKVTGLSPSEFIINNQT